MKQKATILKVRNNNWFYIKSNKTKRHRLHDDPIYLIQQFYIPKNSKRCIEIQKTLYENVSNKYIDKIYLLNERIYSESELGCSSEKITQIDIRERLMVSNIFDFVDSEKLKGYIVFSNTDIFFDSTIKRIKYSNIHSQKKIYSQLRFEYNSKEVISNSRLNCNGLDDLTKMLNRIPGWTNYKCDSADTWIFHSNFNLPRDKRKPLRKHLGKAGIDHIIPKVFFKNNYEIANEPFYIKTYHFHEGDYREWNNSNKYRIIRYSEDYLFCFVNNN